MCKRCAHIQARVSKKGFPQWESLVEDVLAGRLRYGSVSQELASWYWPQFNRSFEAHWQSLSSPLDSALLRQSLQENVKRMVAAKTYNHIGTLVDFAGSGTTRLSREEFMPIAKRINKEFTVKYLSTEIDLVETSMQSVNAWHRFQETKSDLPNLKYETIGDDRVRPEHMALDGIIRPINDPFWDLYFPPNGYGCRCDVQATDAEASPAGSFDLAEIRPEFMNNPGKTGKIFTDQYPYIKAIPREDVAKLDQLFGLKMAA